LVGPSCGAASVVSQLVMEAEWYPSRGAYA